MRPKHLIFFMALLFTGTCIYSQQQIDPYLKTYITAHQQYADPLVQEQLKQQVSWTNFTSRHGAWWVSFNAGNNRPHRATGKGIPTTGTSLQERGWRFIQEELADLAPEYPSLVLESVQTSKFHYLHYKQQYQGLDVLYSRATLRMTTDDFKVIMFGLDTYDQIDVNIQPTLNRESAIISATADLDSLITNTYIHPEVAVLPVPVEQGYQFHLVYTVDVATIDQDNIPGNYRTLVDAHSGEVLYRMNRVYACGAGMMESSLDMQASITDNPFVDPVVRGLPYIQVNIDGIDYYADENGVLNLPFITEATEATIKLRGLYGKVFDGAEGTDMAVWNTEIFPGDQVIAFDIEAAATPSEVSAYYHQNIVHDFMKSHYPDFTDLDTDQTIRTDRHDGSCNAYYDGNSINFFAAVEGSCPASALFKDVVYHEYGHGINNDLYEYLGSPFGMSNGALHEGYADVWGFTITEDPVLAQGFLGGELSYIRKYDGTPKVYPNDITGEVHNDGEIIAGAWWDVYENLAYDMAATVAIWTESMYGIADMPYGEEGALFTDILLDALISDDDNADWTDGTPNDLAIVEAFAEHGITLLGTVLLNHDESMPHPADEPVVLQADISVELPLFLGDVRLHYRLHAGDDFTVATMTPMGAETFSYDFGIMEDGTVIEYYFEVYDIFGSNVLVQPQNTTLDDPALPYFAMIGYSLMATENFDVPAGAWLVNPFGDDDAIDGIWEIGDPVQTSDPLGGGGIIQPGYDNSGSVTGLCAYTGNAPSGSPANSNDVDEGKTSILSPYYDLTNFIDPIFTYYRWFSNSALSSTNRGNDPWQVFITSNGTDFVEVERTFTQDNTWRKNLVRVTDYVGLSETVALLFVAQDSLVPELSFSGQSTLEAAIDELQLWAADVEVPAGNLSHFPEDGYAVYPNPANSELYVLLDKAAAILGYHIYHVNGQLVNQTAVPACLDGKLEIDVQAIPNGLYILQIDLSDRTITTSFVVER
jgi:hypothetical protein